MSDLKPWDFSLLYYDSNYFKANSWELSIRNLSILKKWLRDEVSKIILYLSWDIKIP